MFLSLFHRARRAAIFTRRFNTTTTVNPSSDSNENSFEADEDIEQELSTLKSQSIETIQHPREKLLWRYAELNDFARQDTLQRPFPDTLMTKITDLLKRMTKFI